MSRAAAAARTLEGTPAQPHTLSQSPVANDRDLRFLLFEVLDMDKVMQRPLYAESGASGAVLVVCWALLYSP